MSWLINLKNYWKKYKVKITKRPPNRISTSWQVLKGIVKRRVWIRIYIDDQEPKEYIFQPGSTPEWKARKGFKLLIGNAAGVELYFNGKEVGPLGTLGQVVTVKLPEDYWSIKGCYQVKGGMIMATMTKLNWDGKTYNEEVTDKGMWIRWGLRHRHSVKATGKGYSPHLKRLHRGSTLHRSYRLTIHKTLFNTICMLSYVLTNTSC